MSWFQIFAALLAAGALLSLAIEWKTLHRIRRGQAEIDDLMDYVGSADPAVLDGFGNITLLHDDWVSFDPSASRNVSQHWAKKVFDSPVSDALSLAGAIYAFVYSQTSLAPVILALVVVYELAGGFRVCSSFVAGRKSGRAPSSGQMTHRRLGCLVTCQERKL